MEPTTDPVLVAPPVASKKRWAVLRMVVSIALGGLALYVVAGRTNELSSVGSYLNRVNWGWIVPGFVFEMCSMAAFALIQGRLLRSGGTKISFPALFGITLAGNSITNSLPAGPAWASFFAFRQYRRLGADPTLSAWILLGLFICSSVTLAILATIGLVVASTSGSGSFGIANTIVATLFGVLFIAGAAVLVLRRRGRLEHAAVRVLRIWQKVSKRAKQDPEVLVRQVGSRLLAVSPTRRASSIALGWAMANWVFDIGCLLCSFWAVGVSVPWSGILLAYGAGQLASNLPVTIGGLGVVEGSLEVALVAYGGNKVSMLAAILLYRLMSFWVLLPMGWLAWFGIHLAERSEADQESAIPVVAEVTI